MKNILALNGSPRDKGNTSLLLDSFIEGARENTDHVEVLFPHRMNIDHCRGCLRCNVLRRCSISGDDWLDLSQKILDSDILVIASPIYFHHLPGPLKVVLDRFRSFNHVQITESGLEHTPWQEWEKDFVLLLTMGSPDQSDALPVIDLFDFVKSILGPGNRLHVITATRVAMARQISKTKDELAALYEKLKLPVDLAEEDYLKNMKTLEETRKLGSLLSR